MAQPVWVLSVDLQTKTATFQTGLADAAKAARGSFNDIKGGAGDMGGTVNYSMGEARHSVMLLGEEFGVHLPRALTTFLAGLGPIGPALEAAFPFLAVVVGATLLIEHLAKMREAGEKLTEDQVKFGTAADNAFNTLDQKIIQAQIRSDELRNDHLGALKLQLELINKQSMSELVHAFDELAKAADVVMKELEGHWYTIGIGSDGAKHALETFQTQYNSLLAQGKQEAATGLLQGTLSQAQRVLEMQKQAKANTGGMLTGPGPNADISLAMQAENELKKHGVGFTEKEIAAQEILVKTLQDQVGIQGRVSELKKLDSGNAASQTGNEEASKRAAAARQSAESMLRMGEQSIAADKATAEALLTVHRASLEERLASEVEFAGRNRDVKLAANQAEIAALDKNGKDYQNQLKALNDKTLEINTDYEAKVSELKAKSSVDVYNRDLRSLEQSERAKIEATRQGSEARLAAIDAGIQLEESKNLQDTNFFRELLNQRVQTLREEAKLRAEAAREDADNTEKMGQLTVAAEKQRMALEDSARRVTIQQRIAEETKVANDEYAFKMAALDKEVQGLDKSGKDYENKLKQLQDKERQLTQQHENDIASIKERASAKQNSQQRQALARMETGYAQSFLSVLQEHRSFANMMGGLSQQIVTNIITESIAYRNGLDSTKMDEAKAAARKMYLAGAKFPWPTNVVMAPALGALGFATMMAFDKGGVVPGVGRGDIVPSMLSPGEGIVPGGVMDGLSKLARNGGFDQGGSRNHVTMHVHMHASALDADGMDTVLEKHSDKLQRHFENTLRKMNR